MKLLFISRAYPPVTGGIENQNYELSQWLPKIAEVKTIANTRGKLFLPLFIPYALIRALLLFRRYDAVLLGDGVLGIVGWFLKLFHPHTNRNNHTSLSSGENIGVGVYSKPVISIVHGLDLTYRNFLYQKLWVGFFIKKLDRLIAVGNETIKAGVARGIPEEKFVFIPNGVDINKFYKPAERQELEKFLGENLTGKKVILTSGRLAKRKGVAWFISEVMPKLSENILYVVVGDGPDNENIKNAIEKSGLAERVKMLGYVKDADRDLLFNACDLFVQPNIKIEGDMEGFGISVIEAASCKIPVIASRLEGLQDAIKDGRNGFLIEPGNAGAWAAKISELLSDDAFRKDFGEKARQYVVENFSWEKISRQYLEEIQKVLKK
ncbi:MAG: glycosyltransferase family 4 protein [Patescibacteria group bacterium]